MSKCCFLIVAFLTLRIPEVRGVETDSYRKLGSTVELSPGSVDGPITSIEWKHGKDIAVEWFGNNITEYRQFRGSSMLNISTGHLIIYNVTSAYSGLYIAEINGRIKDSTFIKVISPVPKPTVSTRCNAKKTHCVLTCEGTITDDNGPVTYMWKVGDMHLTGNKTLTLTRENHETFLGCWLENPISSESSIKIANPLHIRSRVALNVSVVTVLLTIALVTVIVLCRNRGGWRRPGEAGPAPSSNVTEREELLTNQQTSASNHTSGSSPAPEEQSSAGPETKVTVHREDNNDTEEQTPAGPETKVTVHQEDSNDTGPEGK